MTHNSLLHNMGKLTLFALPISGQMLLGIVTNIIAMFFVSRLGTQYLAASALGFSTYLVFQTLTATALMSISILISHGAGQQQQSSVAGLVFINGFWAVLILWLPIAIILWNGNDILLLFGQEPHLAALTVGYFHYAVFALLMILLAGVIGQFYRGINRPNITFWTMLVKAPFIQG